MHARRFLETLHTKRAANNQGNPKVSAKKTRKPTQPQTVEVSGCVSEPRDRGSNPLYRCQKISIAHLSIQLTRVVC